MTVSAVAPSSPFKQAMLSPEECYILDNGVDKNIFVWKGADSITDSIKQQKRVLNKLHNISFPRCPRHCFLCIKL